MHRTARTFLAGAQALLVFIGGCGQGDLIIDSSALNAEQLQAQIDASGGGGGGGGGGGSACTYPALTNPSSSVITGSPPVNLTATSGRLAQAFQLPSTLQIAGIAVKIQSVLLGATSLSVELRADQAGSPATSGPLMQMTLPLMGTEANAWILAGFGSGAGTLSAGTTYWAVFSLPSGGDVNLTKVNLPDNIPGFGAMASTNGGISWMPAGSPNNDLAITFHTCH